MFGENIRCFKEDKNNKKIQKEFTNIKVNNKENYQVPHSAMKIKEKFSNPNFTPINLKIKSFNYRFLIF